MRLERNAKCSPSCRQSPKYCGICTCIRFRAKGILFQKTASSETAPTSIDQHSSTQPITPPKQSPDSGSNPTIDDSVSVGDCVLVTFMCGRKERSSVRMVSETDGSEALVSFSRKQDSCKFVAPSQEDVAWVNLANIKTLSRPEIDRWGVYIYLRSR